MQRALLLAVVVLVIAAVFALTARAAGHDQAAAEPRPTVRTFYLPDLPARTPPATSSTTVPPTTTTHTHPPRLPAPPTPPVVRTGECGGWLSTVQAYFPADQVGRACRILYCESQGNPNAKNPRSTASGLFQFLDSTWVTVTGTAPPARAYSPDTQVAAAAKLWASSGWRPWVCQ